MHRITKFKNICLLKSYFVGFVWLVLWSITLGIPARIMSINKSPCIIKAVVGWFVLCSLVMLLFSSIIGDKEHDHVLRAKPHCRYPPWLIGKIMRKGGYFGEKEGVSNEEIYDGRRGVKFSDCWDEEYKWFFKVKRRSD